MDPMTLSLVFTLSSRINPDWISAFHVLRPRNRNDDVVLALTTTGTVKVTYTRLFIRFNINSLGREKNNFM